jgi:UDP-glucose 4-epimerase
MFTDTGRLPTACLRYFNVFGPRQDPKSQYAAAVPIFIDHAVRHQPITIFGDGEQTRDFIYVKDVAAANLFFAAESPATGVFNVAYGRRITINDLAGTIGRLAGSRPVLARAPARPGDVKHSLASIDKLRAAGFCQAHNFDAGLQATVAFFRAHIPARP